MPQLTQDSRLMLDLVAVTSTLKQNVRSKDIKTLKESNNILSFTNFRTEPCFFRFFSTEPFFQTHFCLSLATTIFSCLNPLQ